MFAACVQQADPGVSGGIPFVGCPSGGWDGNRPAPPSGPVPDIADAPSADRLAYYSDGSTAILAPRGWHCASVWGSSGGSLLVTPSSEEAEAFRDLDRRRPTYGVQLTYNHGGTSGRFAVADMIARYFPAHMAFAEQVAAEEYAQPLPTAPYPRDRIRRIGSEEVEFVTTGPRGIGTERSTLAPGERPIRGVVILYPQEDMLMLQLAYRLPLRDVAVAPAIVAEVRRSRGEALQ